MKKLFEIYLKKARESLFRLCASRGGINPRDKMLDLCHRKVPTIAEQPTLP